MKPEDYAWNEFERTAYKTKMNHLPSPYKVAIWDDSEKRLELEQILDRLPQKELARWALENSQDFLSLIDIGDEGEKNKIIRQTYEAFDARLRNEFSPHELRKAGFAANLLSKNAQNQIAKSAARVFVQAISTAHMRGHAIVSADYAIKVRNLQEADKLELVRKEREKQIRLAESFLANVIDKR